MTTKPTVQLEAHEWRSLIVANLNQGATFVNNNAQVSAEQIKAFDDLLARIRGFVGAWHASAPPVVQAPESAPVGDAKANGAAPAKKRGGWPAGKSRKAPAAAVQ